jgi:large subunit ribosomal protein L24
MKIKKGDKVKVLNGKDRGKISTIKEIIRSTNKVIVEGVNIVTKFTKSKGDQKKGGLLKVEGPISVSKVQLIDPKTNKPTRIGIKRENGKVIRIAKKTNEII